MRICESVYEEVLKVFRPVLLSKTWPTDQTDYEKISLVGIEKFPAPPSINQWAISVKLLHIFMSWKIYAYFKQRKKTTGTYWFATPFYRYLHDLWTPPLSLPTFYDFKHANIFVPLWLTSKKDNKKTLPFLWIFLWNILFLAWFHCELKTKS